MADKPVILTEKQLRERCAYWQKALRLQDWDVKVRVVRGNKLAPDTEAHVHSVLRLKSALIQILDPQDYLPENEWPLDMEQSLVHELMHLHMRPCNIEKDTPEDVAEEQAVDLVACALVNLDRQKRPS